MTPEKPGTACWPCQFGRGAYTLKELGLNDPRLRPPTVDGSDGLCRVIGHASTAGTVQANVIEAPAPFMAPAPAGSGEHVHAATRRPISSSEAEWLSALDSIQPTPSQRLLDFLESCSDIAVSWSINKVLLARMTVLGITIRFMGVEPNGEIQIPWSIGGRKDLFRTFAEQLAASIPGAIAFETPKLWKVTKACKQPLNVLDVLSSSSAIRTAIEALHAAMSTTYQRR